MSEEEKTDETTEDVTPSAVSDEVTRTEGAATTESAAAESSEAVDEGVEAPIAQPLPLPEPEGMEKKSARALIATYLQMSSHAEMARQLQRARARSLQRRMERTAGVGERARYRKQLVAQEEQGAAIENAVSQMRERSPQLAEFARAGLSYEDFRDLGLGDVVREEDVVAAYRTAPLEEPSATEEQSAGQD